MGSATLPVTYSKSCDNVLPSLNLKAAFSDNLAVSLDGINLLGAKKYVYGKDENQVREINDYGRTVTFSVRGKF